MPVKSDQIKTIPMPARASREVIESRLIQHAKLSQAQALHAEAARLRGVAQRLADMATAIEEGNL